MYVLAEMKDIVHVKPWQFNQDLRVVIENELNLKFANKVIKKKNFNLRNM
jgi:DNA-directed RNA polymerase subunit E'/Rpb7